MMLRDTDDRFICPKCLTEGVSLKHGPGIWPLCHKCNYEVPMVSETEEREKFHQWAKDHNWKGSLKRSEGVYSTLAMQMAWEAWLANRVDPDLLYNLINQVQMSLSLLRAVIDSKSVGPRMEKSVEDFIRNTEFTLTKHKIDPFPLFPESVGVVKS